MIRQLPTEGENEKEKSFTEGDVLPAHMDHMAATSSQSGGVQSSRARTTTTSVSASTSIGSHVSRKAATTRKMVRNPVVRTKQTKNQQRV